MRIRLGAEGFRLDGCQFACGARRLFEAVREECGHRRDVDVVDVELDTLMTVVVPSLYFDAPLAESYLTVNNMLPEGDVAVRSEVDEINIIMACRGDMAEYFRSTYGEKLLFSSPLSSLLRPSPVPCETRICFTDSNVYIVVWSGGLKFAEALPYSSPDDVVYYLDALDNRYAIAGGRISLSGPGTRRMAKALKSFFNLK
jgi:hypothetical protein